MCTPESKFAQVFFPEDGPPPSVPLPPLDSPDIVAFTGVSGAAYSRPNGFLSGTVKAPFEDRLPAVPTLVPGYGAGVDAGAVVASAAAAAAEPTAAPADAAATAVPAPPTVPPPAADDSAPVLRLLVEPTDSPLVQLLKTVFVCPVAFGDLVFRECVGLVHELLTMHHQALRHRVVGSGVVHALLGCIVHRALPAPHETTILGRTLKALHTVHPYVGQRVFFFFCEFLLWFQLRCVCFLTDWLDEPDVSSRHWWTW